MKTLFRNLKITLIVLLILAAGIYYYVALPAINIHNPGFWGFLIGFAVLALALYAWRKRLHTVEEIRADKGLRFGTVVIGLVVLVFAFGALLSSPIVNAKKYRNLVTPTEREFTEDIPQIHFDQIPLLDRESAILIGNRKMGSMVEMVSQFEVSDLYSQINYQGTPVRVSPLVYANPIKWLTNQSEGIPAYMMIDMTNQDSKLVKLDKPIKYSKSEYFNRNIYRYLRFTYPTYLFDQISFEINEEGIPYWVCPVREYTIGLFGGKTIGRVVLCNAQTGETQEYTVEDCPQWVDRVYPADLLLELYNYHGTLNKGFFNSVLSQKGCLKTTEGYNYIAMDDDVWLYTGVTSVNADESNVGFVLINQRTMETRYYAIAGAEEFSAMDSAEGQVQNLGYTAAFPLLLNIANEPTYVLALKDEAGLVKKYAMVNVQKYQNVAIGSTISECQDDYVKLLKNSGISSSETTASEQITGTIARITQSVIEGNSHFYLMLEDDDRIYDVAVNEFVEIVAYDVGDDITFEYVAGEPLCTVTEIGSK